MHIPSILFYAFRYSLGRMTFAPSEVTEAIKENIHLFTESEKLRIIKEIHEADEEDRIGMDIDRKTWLNLIEFIEETL